MLGSVDVDHATGVPNATAGHPDPGNVAPLSAQMVAERSAQPLPSSGNLIGFIQVLLKANLTLCGEDQAARRAAYERFQKVTSLGEAQDYFQSLIPKIEEAAQKQSEIDRR